MSEQYEYVIVYNEDYGTGVIINENAHYSMVEFNTDGHRWRIALEHDDYMIVNTVSIGQEEIE